MGSAGEDTVQARGTGQRRSGRKGEPRSHSRGKKDRKKKKSGDAAVDVRGDIREEEGGEGQTEV